MAESECRKQGIAWQPYIAVYYSEQSNFCQFEEAPHNSAWASDVSKTHFSLRQTVWQMRIARYASAASGQSDTDASAIQSDR